MTERRLAAILVADVVGYSKLVGGDEAGTLAHLRTLRTDVVDPAIAKHAGRLFKAVGDGFLVEFSSAVQAVACAKAIQDANTNGHLPLRIGVHLGDVIVEGEDLMGDGVNVAARIEGTAVPGGIAISRQVHDQVRDKLDIGFEDEGEVALKNLTRPVHIFAVAAGKPVVATSPSLALPDKPSIAVLPFQNMSGDPEQDYFADGIVEDIITGLSRNKGLFVVARNSSFAYKGKSSDIRQVGRELGVRYVLEGSLRKAGNRVRITGQLIEAANGAHLWADRFDGSLEDIFELQDQITSRVIAGIAPSLETAEFERVKRKVGNLQAYDCYLRSLGAVHRWSPEGNKEALSYAQQAVALDPDFALGHMSIVRALLQQLSFRWIVDQFAVAQQAERSIRRALDLDRNDARILTVCGQATIMILRRVEEGAGWLDEAVSLDPNSALAWMYHANAQNLRNEPEKAIEDLEKVLRLSPLDPTKFYALTVMARVHNTCGRYDSALQYATEALRIRPNFDHALIEKVVANSLAGRLGPAREDLANLQKLHPEDRVSTYNPPHLPLSAIPKYREGLRLAGLPE
jgi:adenylate cyclase